jgi:uncharacterized protein (UPF0332 family)
MHASDFWDLADRLLVTENNPPGNRTAISRAYYAAFLTASDFLGAMGITLRGEKKHTDAAVILSNTNDPSVDAAGVLLGQLREERNKADYTMNSRDQEDNAYARPRVTEAQTVMATLNGCRLDASRFARVSP